MKILDRYLLKEQALPFLLALSLLTFILLMDKLFELINLIVVKRIPFLIVLKVFGLSLPYILAMTVPMAVLVAVLMAFGRLAQDNELTALKSSGLPLFRLMLAPLAAGAVMTAAVFFFSDLALPEANHTLKNLLMDINQTKPALNLKENIFNSDFPGYNIMIRKVDARDSRLKDIIIYEQAQDAAPRIILAESGRMAVIPGSGLLRLELSNGEIHEADPRDPTRYHRMSFRAHAINLPYDAGQVDQIRTSRGDREMTSRMMRASIADIRAVIGGLQGQLRDSSKLQPWQRDDLKQEIFNRTGDIRRYQVEIQKKLAIPVACLVFVLLGIPLAALTRRGGMGTSFGLSLGFFTLYYLCLVGGEELADRQLLSPVMAMWMANIILGAAGAALFLWQNFELRWRRTGA
ncbi:MAG: LptF/LptG family permease [Candidatus Edwardsbacteria bacterium]|nr:LptF/LptG family permease [Candidatus Edwardsbacteria bacterium]